MEDGMPPPNDNRRAGVPEALKQFHGRIAKIFVRDSVGGTVIFSAKRFG
jgi:hypothetical protein